MSDLGAAVQTVVRRCLAVKEGEGVVVLVDRATRAIGDALREEAAAAGGDAILTIMDERATDGTEPPPAVAAALAACDVFIAPTSRSLSHTSARKRAIDHGARGATMPGVTEDMLARVMAVDFDTMAARSKAVAALLDSATRARVSCPRGTDLELALDGRPGISDDGELGAPGRVREPALRRGVHRAGVRRRHRGRIERRSARDQRGPGEAHGGGGPARRGRRADSAPSSSSCCSPTVSLGPTSPSSASGRTIGRG